MRLLKTFPYLFFILYLVLGLRTLPSYGINWDETPHFIRGQTFLHFLLTGKKDFNDLPELEGKSHIQDFGYVFADEKNRTVIRRSMFQYIPFSFYIEDIQNRGNHPVFSDMMATVTNYIFFQKLGIASDVYSHNFYSVFLASILVLATYLWVRKIFDEFTGLIASISLALFPLFWGELHYNIKDVPETVYFALSVYIFFFAITKLNFKYLIAFSIVGAMAFATKFNFLFSIFIFTPWILWLIATRARYINRLEVKKFLYKQKRFVIYAFFIPLIFVLFWVVTYPASWFEPRLLLASFAFYKKIGITANAGLKLYPLYYVIFATPVVILIYAGIGIIRGLQLEKRQKEAFYLVLLWLTEPIIRVMLPKMNIYGGARQIMEYIPAMAILAGIGAGKIVDRFKRYWLLIQAIIILSFLPITMKMISMHPNEGVYFNWLIGGLKGAEEKQIPDAGQSLGNEYRQAIQWLNKHAEPNAKLVLGYEYLSNLPRIWVRNDITYNDESTSGTLRKGEYIIGSVQVEDKLMWYTMRYLENYLNPVFIVAVDGVPLMKIWKNDIQHTKNGYIEEDQIQNIIFTSDESSVKVTLPQRSFVTRIEFDIPGETCQRFEKYAGRFIISNEKTAKKPLILPAIDFNLFEEFSYPNPFYLLAAEEATSISFNLYEPTPCLTNVRGIRVYKLKNPIQ